MDIFDLRDDLDDYIHPWFWVEDDKPDREPLFSNNDAYPNVEVYERSFLERFTGLTKPYREYSHRLYYQNSEDVGFIVHPIDKEGIDTLERILE